MSVTRANVDVVAPSPELVLKARNNRPTFETMLGLAVLTVQTVRPLNGQVNARAVDQRKVGCFAATRLIQSVQS